MSADNQRLKTLNKSQFPKNDPNVAGDKTHQVDMENGSIITISVHIHTALYSQVQ